jgi:mono/diheme cytochrome c family protein
MLKKFFSIILLPFLLLACAENSASKPPVDTQAGSQTNSSQQKPVKTDEGKTVFTTYCMACHQKDGSGVPRMFPPLQKSEWVNGDKKRLINILLHGLEGDITVNDETYSQTMPKQDYLTDKQIASVLSYIRQNFGNQADSVKVKDVKTLRK